MGSRTEFTFTADDSRAGQVRPLLGSLVRLVSDDRLLANRVAMTGAELLEAALALATSEVRLRVIVESPPVRVKLEVEGSAAAEGLVQVDRLMQQLAGDDALDAYVRALRTAPEKEPPAAHLRLARIRYEGKMGLRSEVAERRFRIIAEAPEASEGHG